MYLRELNATSSDVVLALYQRWALQVLNALDFLHTKGVVMNAVTGSALWHRQDMSIAIAGFVAASCDELEIEEGHWGSMAYDCYSNPWDEQAHQRRVRMERTLAQKPEKRSVIDIDLEPIGGSQPERDIFDWAVWVCEMMTGKTPLEHGMACTERDMGYFEELSPRLKSLEYGRYEDWPLLPNDMLGPVVLKALCGEYETAKQALKEARELSQACGRTFSATQCDEIDGFEWEKEFSVREGENGTWELRLRKVG